MAAPGLRYSVVLLSLCSLSLFIVAQSQEPTQPAGHHATKVDNPQTAGETSDQGGEQPAVEDRRWEATEAGNAASDDAAATGQQDTSAQETKVSPPGALARDDFQEELVIRPLRSGDIYASFQFRTLWDTEFSGNKGKLAVSLTPFLLCQTGCCFLFNTVDHQES